MRRYIKHFGKGRNMVTCNHWGDKPNKYTKKENNKAIRQAIKKIDWF